MKGLGWKLIFLILIAAAVFLWLIKTPLMARYVSAKINLPVSISRISLWPSETGIYHFRIRNPHGFKLRDAFKADHTKIDYDLHRLVGEISEIDQIAMRDVYLSIEFTNPLGTSNNWTAIAANMPPREGGAIQEVLIHKLSLDNLNVEIRGLGLTEASKTKHIDHMEFIEIDSRQGFPTEELVKKIFKTAGLEEYIQDAFNPSKEVDKVLNPVKNIFGR